MYDPLTPKDVFVSHAAVDLPIAKELTAALSAKGVTTWVAQVDIRPGESWADALYHALSSAPVVALLVSEAASKSPHVLRELDMALDLKKRVVPVQLEAIQLEGGFYYFTRGLQFYDWNADSAVAVERIVEQVANARHLPDAGEAAAFGRS